MSDPAHEATDRVIARIEKDLAREYAQAQRELKAKFDDYTSRFQLKDKKWQEWVKSGKRTQAEYVQWRKGQLMSGNRWLEMKNQMADDLVNVHHIAQNIANKGMAQVYAVNHNYATYDIEHGSQMSTSYTLYDKDTVERIWRDNPKLYPKPGRKMQQAIRDGKVKKWCKKQIQSVITQGIIQGDSIPNLAKRLEAVTGGEHKAALRNARTMATGVQNAGRIDAYRRANMLGIPTQKVWLAALDSRTRHWHRMLDGEKKDIDEPFKNDFGKIMYPGDPEANGANIYNCRCTLLSSIKGFEIDLTDPSVRPMSSLGNMSYDEWKAETRSTSNPIDRQEKIGEMMHQVYLAQYRGHGSGKKITIPHVGKAPTPSTPVPDTFEGKIRAIQNRVAANGNITEADLQEAGKLVAQEVKGYRDPLKKAMDDAQKALDDYRNAHGQSDRTLVSALWRAQTEYQGTREENAQWLKKKLSGIRKMGSEGLDVAGHLKNSRSPMRKIIEKAYDCYPAEWVADSVRDSRLTVGQNARGYYWHYMKEIKISNYDSGYSYQNAFHELGHRFEYTRKGIVQAEQEFYKRRTAGESLQWLGAGYKKTEKTRKDNFINPYMGKDYGGRSFELVSMGFEYAFADPVKLATDPDMEAWIYGILCLV